MTRVELELRHVPRFKVIDCLVQVGGVETEAWTVQGDGWLASLEALEPDVIGIVSIDRDRLVIQGSRWAVERVTAFVEQRLRTRRRSG